MIDPRLREVRKIIESIVRGVSLNTGVGKILLTSNNHMIICTYDTVLYETVLDYPDPLPPIGFVFDDIKDINQDIDIDIPNNTIIVSELLPIINYYSLFLKPERLIVNETNIASLDYYSEYLNLKSQEGVRFCKINRIDNNGSVLIPFFASFPKLAKADELSIRVYDMYTGNEMNRYQLVNFEIYKKKINRPYQMYFRILDISQPINN